MEAIPFNFGFLMRPLCFFVLRERICHLNFLGLLSSNFEEKEDHNVKRLKRFLKEPIPSKKTHGFGDVLWFFNPLIWGF